MLRWLKDRYGPGEFDSVRLASALGLGKKLVSNDLRRLYRMSFLKRRRVKRSCIGRRGFINRGFQYTYSFSRHGLSYVEWLERGKVVEDFVVADLRSDTISRLPYDMKRGVSAFQMAEEVKPYRGPGSGYKPSPSDLLLNMYANVNHDRLMVDFREMIKEFFKTSLDVARLNSEKTALYSENEVLKIVNLALEKERDRSKKETNDLFWAGSKALVENGLVSGEIFRKANQIIEYYERLFATVATCLCLLFPPKAVDRLFEFAWKLEKASRKSTAIRNEAQPSTSPNLSISAKPQESAKVKTLQEIHWIYGEDKDDRKRHERLCLNQMARIIREKKTITMQELCTHMKLAPTTIYQYAGWLRDACPDIKFENGIFHTIWS